MAIYFTKNTNNVEDIEQMNNVVNKINKTMTNATSNINQLTDLNIKAEKLSDNVNKALPINAELKENIKIGQPLVQEATSKNTELQASLEKTKEFINGLDGSQNIPQLRLDVNALQNGLKSNQALEYRGSSISANDTLEGRTEGMRIGGRTLKNLLGRTYSDYYSLITDIKPNTIYTVIKFNNRNRRVGIFKDNSSIGVIEEYTDRMVFTFNSGDMDDYMALRFYQDANKGEVSEDDKNIVILEGNHTKTNDYSYFEGMKSSGEMEQEGNKYKISILSSGKNRNINKTLEAFLNDNNIIQSDATAISYIAKIITKGTYYLNMDGGDRCSLGYFRKYPQVGDKAEIAIKDTSILVPSSGYIVAYVLSNKNASTVSNVTISEKQNIIYEPYKCDKKDILIKEPLRSKGDKCDILYEDNGQVKVDRYVGIRKYQEGDEKNKKVITDKVNTVYILDTPTTEVVENCVDIDLDTFGEKTYFSIENSLPGSLDFKVPSNIVSIVQSNSKAINELYDLINNVIMPGMAEIVDKTVKASMSLAK